MLFNNSNLDKNEILVEVKDVGKTYRQYKRPIDRLLQFFSPKTSNWFKDFVALENVSFKLKKGEILGIVGANGAGKSTLLQIVAGTVTPTHGYAKTNGRVAAILELGSGFNPEFTGRENILINAATLGLSRAEINQRMNSIIEFANIGTHIDQPVKTYSSGMIVRLAFSIATSVDPDLLIIDEALSVGDGAFRRRSFDRIMEIKDRGTTILFCSHVMYHVESFCDKVLWLHKGRVQLFGRVSEVLGPYQEFIDTYEQPLTDGTGEDQIASLQNTLEIDTQGPKRLNASAKIKVAKVALDGVYGEELYGTSLNSKLEVSIEFESDSILLAPTAAIVFSNDRGKIIGSCTSLSKGFNSLRLEDGTGSFGFNIDSLKLNKGRYRVGVYLFCERGLHGYDMIDPIANLNLSHPGLELGPWLLDGSWK